MMTDFQNLFTNRFTSEYATKVSLIIPPQYCTLNVSLHYLVKHQYRKTIENLTHASLSTTDHKVV